MNPQSFNPGDPDHIVALNEQVEQIATIATPPATWPLWTAIVACVIIGGSGLTVGLMRGKPQVINNVPVPTVSVEAPAVNIPAEAIKVNATVDTAALTGSVEKGTSKVADAVDKATTAVTTGNGNKAAVESAQKALEAKLAALERVVADGHKPVQVTPETPKAAPTLVAEENPEDGNFTFNWTQTAQNEVTLLREVDGGKMRGFGPTYVNPPSKAKRPDGWEKAIWGRNAKGDWCLKKG